MARYQVRVGELKLSADIEDPGRRDWTGSLREAPDMPEGDVQVVILGPNGEERTRSRARVVPGGPYQPTVLEGLEPFD